MIFQNNKLCRLVPFQWRCENPKKITGEIEKITKYRERKKDLERRIKILEKSDLYKHKQNQWNKIIAPMNLTELKQKPASELVSLSSDLGLDNLARSRKQDVIFEILKAHAKKGEDIHGDGVLEILQGVKMGVSGSWEAVDQF